MGGDDAPALAFTGDDGHGRYLLALSLCVSFNCSSAIAATMKKISVLMAAARPKFWPLSVKAMR